MFRTTQSPGTPLYTALCCQFITHCRHTHTHHIFLFLFTACQSEWEAAAAAATAATKVELFILYVHESAFNSPGSPRFIHLERTEAATTAAAEEPVLFAQETSEQVLVLSGKDSPSIVPRPSH